jgi:2-C-methyl-D-erythritol 4-phosphate cytidylyltransferase / 2-C-methyl-D-erythritol 2,4-cyclodiphosphate synthase
VMLCGVRVPHAQGLIGHSDADVALHAATDAVLGAIGDGDIGQHYPPGDARWKGAASARFLADAIERVRARGGRLINLDITLICEEPRIGPHRDRMRAQVAEICGVVRERINVKATTTERLGFTGRGEGIAAQAVASVALPPAEGA